MQQVIARTLALHRMLRFGRKVGVAVSGGADSVYLLHAMADAGLASAVLHVNHKLRGAESDQDEAFVRELGRSFRLPLYVESLPPARGNLEQEARKVRYGFFSDVLRKSDLVDCVATGHTLDDQAETVLARLLRGSGSAGLAGIRPVTATRIVRPILDVSAAEIRDYLTRKGISWREDLSNHDQKFLRNRIRRMVLPVLKDVCGPSLPKILAETAQLAAAEQDYWEAEMDRIGASDLRCDGNTVILSAKSTWERPVAVQRRLIRRAISIVRENLRSIDFGHVEAIRCLVGSPEGTGRLQLPGVDIMRSFDQVRLSPIGYDARLPRHFEAIAEIPGVIALVDRQITVCLEPVMPEAVYNDEVKALDGDLLAGPLILRNWCPGDVFRPEGYSGSEKIKSLFQENRIPLWERRGWPVITVQHQGGENIVWTRQFGVSADYAARPQSKRLISIREVAPQVTESKRLIPASMELKRAPGLDPRASSKPGAEVL